MRASSPLSHTPSATIGLNQGYGNCLTIPWAWRVPGTNDPNCIVAGFWTRPQGARWFSLWMLTLRATLASTS